METAAKENKFEGRILVELLLAFVLLFYGLGLISNARAAVGQLNNSSGDETSVVSNG